MSARFDDVNTRMDEMRTDLLARMSDMQSNINARMSDVNGRFDDMNTRMAEMRTDLLARMSDMQSNIDTRVDDMRFQLSRDHDTLATKVDVVDQKLTQHVSDHEVHEKWQA